MPLLEIVSRPHVRSAEQARQYVAELRSILVACAISDGKMEEGSMRVDANISVRREGSDELRTRCEIKNVNSLRSLVRAIEYEARRQADLHASGDKVTQETRHWDEADGRTHTMRSKEEADDYRYFPEPDLVPVDLGAERVAEIAATLPLLPAARRHRLAAVTGEPHTSEAIVVVVERGQDDQALVRHGRGRSARRRLALLGPQMRSPSPGPSRATCRRPIPASRHRPRWHPMRSRPGSWCTWCRTSPATMASRSAPHASPRWC